jgi:hypothetical protein
LSARLLREKDVATDLLAGGGDLEVERHHHIEPLDDRQAKLWMIVATTTVKATASMSGSVVTALRWMLVPHVQDGDPPDRSSGRAGRR